MKLVEITSGQRTGHRRWLPAQLSPHDARRNTATQSGLLSHGLWVTSHLGIGLTESSHSRAAFLSRFRPGPPNGKNRQGDDGSIGPIGSTRMPDAVTHHTCIKSSTEYELGLILKEIRFITDQVSRSSGRCCKITPWICTNQCFNI